MYLNDHFGTSKGKMQEISSPQKNIGMSSLKKDQRWKTRFDHNNNMYEKLIVNCRCPMHGTSIRFPYMKDDAEMLIL